MPWDSTAQRLQIGSLLVDLAPRLSRWPLASSWGRPITNPLRPLSCSTFLRSLLTAAVLCLHCPVALLNFSTVLVASATLLYFLKAVLDFAAVMRRGENDGYALLHPTLYTQAALRVTPPLVLCVLLPAITQGSQQQHEWWMEGGMGAALNLLKAMSLLATAVGLSADISNHMTEAEVAKAKRMTYTTRRRRLHVMIKVPGAHPEQVPASMHDDMQYRLQALWPDLHCHRLSVREGCVIVELDIARGSLPGGAPGDSRSAAEWLDVLQLDSLDGLADGQVVSVQIDGQLSFMKFDEETRRWTVVPDPAGAAASFLQLDSQFVSLDSKTARLALDLGALAGQEVTFEAVSGGKHQPCKTAESGEVGEEGQVLLEVDLGAAQPGLLRCNVWTKSTTVRPTSCLLASMSVLLLPAGCAKAAAELARVAAASEADMMLDICSDLGELLEATTAPSEATATGGYLQELAGSAGELAAWCGEAGCAALGLLVAEQVQLLGQAIADDSNAPEQHAAAAAAAPAKEDKSMYASVVAAARRFDTAMPVGRAELRSSSLPPKLWAIVVVLKCCAASVRSLTSGAGLPELVPLALWGLPYLLILASHWAAGAAARAPAPVRRLGRWLARHSRLGLHLHRSLLVALMGLEYLATPFVFKITSSGVDLPAKVLYMVTEAYDYRLAILCILCVDLPAFYVLYSQLGVPYVAAHVAVLGLLGVTVQLCMEGWRARCEKHRSAKKAA